MRCVDINKMIFFFFNDTATTEIYTLSLHDALPISLRPGGKIVISGTTSGPELDDAELTRIFFLQLSVIGSTMGTDRKSTRLNSSHANISYAVFCLKKKKYSFLHMLYTFISDFFIYE